MVIKQRAISNDDKQERRDAILNAAGELLTKDEYHDISIARIARKAGLAKGTIFLYFKSKEELFLQLQIRVYKSWFEDINGRLTTSFLRKNINHIDVLVENIMASLKAHPMMTRLTPILHVILERNIDYKTTLEFKRFLLNEVRTTGRLIEQRLLFLRKNDGAQFLLHLQVLLIGLIQLTNPAPIVKQVIETERMEVFQLSFEERLPAMLALLIKGMTSAHKG